MEKMVRLRGKPSNRLLKKRNDELTRKVRWLRRQVSRQRKTLNSYQIIVEQIAVSSPELSARWLGKVKAVIIRGPGDPNGRSDRFEFPHYPSLKDEPHREAVEEEAAS